jgi:hypothetical protein
VLIYENLTKREFAISHQFVMRALFINPRPDSKKWSGLAISKSFYAHGKFETEQSYTAAADGM